MYKRGAAYISALSTTIVYLQDCADPHAAFEGLREEVSSYLQKVLRRNSALLELPDLPEDLLDGKILDVSNRPIKCLSSSDASRMFRITETVFDERHSKQAFQSRKAEDGVKMTLRDVELTSELLRAANAPGGKVVANERSLTNLYFPMVRATPDLTILDRNGRLVGIVEVKDITAKLDMNAYKAQLFCQMIVWCIDVGFLVVFHNKKPTVYDLSNEIGDYLDAYSRSAITVALNRDSTDPARERPLPKDHTTWLFGRVDKLKMNVMPESLRPHDRLEPLVVKDRPQPRGRGRPRKDGLTAKQVRRMESALKAESNLQKRPPGSSSLT